MTGKFDKKNHKKSGSGFQYWFFFQAFSYLWHLSVHFTMPIQLSHVRCHEMVVVHLGLYSLSWSIWQLASVSFILCLKTKNSTNGTFSKNNFFFIKFIDFIISVLFLCGSVPSLVSQSFYGLLESTILYSNSSVSLSKLELFWCPRMFCNIEKG